MKDTFEILSSINRVSAPDNIYERIITKNNYISSSIIYSLVMTIFLLISLNLFVYNQFNNDNFSANSIIKLPITALYYE